jgi:hypothetical protein
MKKPYRLAICSGRYQHIHKIHEFMINTGLDVAERVIVFIGEAEKNRTANNPFTWMERKELIELIFDKEVNDGKLVVYPLTGLGEFNMHVSEWCNYACENAHAIMGIKPDLIIEGPDKRAMSFFKPGDMDYISELVIAEGIIDNGQYLKFRGTEIRKYLLFGDFNIWKNYVNEKLWDKFSKLRKILIECQGGN